MGNWVFLVATTAGQVLFVQLSIWGLFCYNHLYTLNCFFFLKFFYFNNSRSSYFAPSKLFVNVGSAQATSFRETGNTPPPPPPTCVKESF